MKVALLQSLHSGKIVFWLLTYKVLVCQMKLQGLNSRENTNETLTNTKAFQSLGQKLFSYI